MKMSKSEYAKYVSDKMPPSPIIKNCLMAFLFGGVICCIGQLINDAWSALGLIKDDASSATTISMSGGSAPKSPIATMPSDVARPGDRVRCEMPSASPSHASE